MLEKELNKNIYEAKDTKITLLTCTNKRTNTNKIFINNKDNSNNGNGNVTKLNMLTNLMQVPTNCSLDDCCVWLECFFRYLICL